MKKYLYIFILSAVIVAGLYGYFVAGNNLRAWRALHTGSTYVEKLYSDYTVLGKNCQGEDSDSNGYVTCNFRLKPVDANNTSPEKTITLQCPTFIKSYMGTSCKEMGFVINGQ
jgi:hypothetical protein